MKPLIGLTFAVLIVTGCSSGSDSPACPDIPKPTPLTISGHIRFNYFQPLDSAKLICYWTMPGAVDADPKYISGHGTLFDARDSFWITLDGTAPTETRVNGANCHAAALASGGYIILTTNDGRFLGAVDSVMALCFTANYPFTDSNLRSFQGGYHTSTSDSARRLYPAPNTGLFLTVDSSLGKFHFPRDPYTSTAIY
jgi:hypothetical protein